jgi:plastocyanin
MRLSKLMTVAVFSLFFASPAAAQPAQLVVRVWSFAFAPSPIHLTAGKSVTLTFVNQSGSSHDFSAPGFFKHARITAGAAPDNEIELGPHETRTLTLIPAAGTYHAHCSHFLHKQMGMSDLIIVD